MRGQGYRHDSCNFFRSLYNKTPYSPGDRFTSVWIPGNQVNVTMQYFLIRCTPTIDDNIISRGRVLLIQKFLPFFKHLRQGALLIQV